jgi:diaminohydroxyphosphoribosylaminopyrimidine deaminase/5-amino-6-(5-phosphoribosylamino)uracil reductase
LQQGLVDEIIYYIAPTLLGSSARAQVELPLEKMAEQMRLDVSQIRQVGDDIRVIAKPRYLAQQTSSAVK